MKSYGRLRSNDLGCTTQNLITMHIGLPDARYKKPDRTHFFEALLERVRALPGVTAAGFVNAIPGQGYWGDRTFTIAEHPPLPLGKGAFALIRWTDPNYFEAIGIPIRRGRTFNPSLRLDRADEILVSQSFADRFLPGEEPLGKNVRSDDLEAGNGPTRSFVIVGVVADTRYAISEDTMPTMYFSLDSGNLPVGTLVIRSNHDPAQFALPVERIVAQMDADLPVSDILTIDQMVGGHTIDESFNATLLAAFAGLSLALAAVGLFGVMSYIVAQRTGEIGIRIALGAQRGQVLSRMLVDGLKPALLGLALGLIGSAAAVRAIKSMLYRTEPLDPIVFALVAGVLLAVALMACLAPAWRASRLDPMRALRSE
jgi:putative ABC transport system permease protein